MTVVILGGYRRVKHLKQALVDMQEIIVKLNDVYGPQAEAVAGMREFLQNLSDKPLSAVEREYMAHMEATVTAACHESADREDCVQLFEKLITDTANVIAIEQARKNKLHIY